MTNVTVNTASTATPNVVTADPVTNDGRVMVRQTVTGMEQCIAAGAGLITAGPLGAAAAWGMIKGVQGKWAPWTVCGFVAAPILGVIQLAFFTAIANAAPVVEFDGTEKIELVTPDYSQAAAVAHVDVPAAFGRF